MEEDAKGRLVLRLGQISDPRMERTKLHSLQDILVIAVLATICAAESYPEIAEFGEDKEDWLKTFLELSNGIPSHDTFRRVLQLLKPAELEQAFREWAAGMTQLEAGEIIAIDGKHLKGSKRKGEGGNAGLRFVSAWATENRVVLGQVKTQEKSNEITAIPELLQSLSLSGCVVTIDAMGCQKEIVQEIQKQKADYVIALKGNQGDLHQEVRQYFEWAAHLPPHEQQLETFETLEKGHGRLETRRCQVTADIAWFAQKGDWAGLQSIVMVEAEREIVGQEATRERRYFISSLAANAAAHLHAVRSHWQVENSLHWVLDVAFREDACQVKNVTGATNLAVLRKIALNFLNQEKTSRRSIKGKMLKAGRNHEYLLKVLNI
jgi:predicted transposase YbfD/YdcC